MGWNSMRRIKSIVKYLFSSLGYEIVRKQNLEVRFANFQDLVHAYEFRLGQLPGSTRISENEGRPRLLGRLLGTPPSEAYFIIESLANTASFEGDVCEFGVAQGETSALIANEIRHQNKMLHLFDSFEGLPEPTEKDLLIDDIFSLGSIDQYAGKMSIPESMVLARLRTISFPKDRFVIHKGFIETLIYQDQNLPGKISFAYVDFDFYEPTKIVLNYLHHTAVPGAEIIVDDYDFFSSGVKAAVDEFIDEKNASSPVYHVLRPHKQLGCFIILKKLL
jgi:O-methyltransferase